MAINVGHRNSPNDPDVMIEMNMTPLIDVMLVLLIMLIITIPIQNHMVNLNMPISAPPPSAPPTVVTIDVDSDGTVLWNGLTLPDRATLESKLQSVVAIPVQPEVHVRPNKLVAYKSVAAVLASAQRAGVTKIGIIGNEQFIK
jgi:biopolymer transport protein ExbD